MFSRRGKSEPPAAEKAGAVVLRESDQPQAAQALMTKTEVIATRKPSERFMRKPLAARSKASHSERRHVADLANQLEQARGNDGVLNEAVKFHCYRPGSKRPPG